MEAEGEYQQVPTLGMAVLGRSMAIIDLPAAVGGVPDLGRLENHGQSRPGGGAEGARA